MNTTQAFKNLIDTWKTYPQPFTNKNRLAKHRFLTGKPISEDKMKEVLLSAGWKIKSALIWSKPKNHQ